ncbi:sialin-like isoform X2 [Drosophila busckii]|nr:sialin-like isoform X2 [Drosophila busckii]
MNIIYGLKVNYSICLIAMVNHSAVLGSDNDTEKECKLEQRNVDNGPQTQNGPYNWSEPLQGTLLSCYYWGFICSQIPGARLAESLSAKWVLFAAVLVNIAAAALTPLLAQWLFLGLIFTRFLSGLFGGAAVPAMYVLILAWAPLEERYFLSTICFLGTTVGTVWSIMISGAIAENCGWIWVFYGMAAASCLWLILWIILIQDSPNKQTFISPEERELINKSLAGEPKELPTLKAPWSKILRSKAFWAILIAHTCSNWGWYMFLLETPFYYKQIFKFPLDDNGVFSALPFLPMIGFGALIGFMMDRLMLADKLTPTTARKIATSIASLVPALCLVGLLFIGCHSYVAVIIVFLAVMCMGAMFSGFVSNQIDISPNYAVTLVALTNTVATLPAIIVPILAGFLTNHNETTDAWRIIFGTAIIMFLIEFIIYVSMGSAEVEPWN